MKEKREGQGMIVSILKYSAIASGTILMFSLFLEYPKYLFSFSFSLARFFGMTIGFTMLYAFHKHIPAKILNTCLFIVFLVGLMLYPLYAEQTRGVDLFVLPITGILLGVIPIAIFNPLTQKFSIVAWNSVFVLSCVVVTSLSLDALPSEELEMFSYLLSKEMMIPLAFVGSFVAMNWFVYQYQLEDAKAENKFQAINQILGARIKFFKRRSIQLNSDNNELEKTQQELLQAKMQLEEKVDKETRNLNEKTKVLLKYSYINSHVLRAPIARIKSVLEVWDQLSDKDRKNIIVSSTDELKSIIDIISELDENQVEKASDSLKDFYYFK